jgi:stage IV sporulation protein FB
MGSSFEIARIAGTSVRVHVTFFLLLAYIAWINYGDGGGWNAAVEGVTFVLVLFACVVAHEFGHIFAARRYGIRTPVVTVLPIGGVASLERMPQKPSQEIAVALAGPAVNIAIAAALMLVVPDLSVENSYGVLSGGTNFLQEIAYANIFLALFNMIPAFPMDGGRVLRALLAAWLGFRQGTRVAALLGQALAAVFALAAVYYARPILFLVALFVFLAAGAEARAVERSARYQA